MKNKKTNYAIARVRTSYFKFKSTRAALIKVLEFSKKDDLKYIIYTGVEEHPQGKQTPIYIVRRGIVLCVQALRRKNKNYWNEIVNSI